MEYVQGKILTPEGFRSGYLGFENNTIVEAEKGNSPKKPICKGFIVPTLVNAHTHVGDSFIKKKDIDLPKNVEELVAPPNGLKHKLLKEASEKEIVDGMKNSIDKMVESGVSVFCDFRENGIKGINQLKNALTNTKLSSIILSRPVKMEYNKDEINVLLENSNGIGLSSISDWNYSELARIAGHAKKKGKVFAIHASERIREDIDLVLDLKPDLLIHMVKANKSDLEIVKDNDIPIVVCPRSNNFFGLKTDLELFKKVGVKLILGTDNAMINSPKILDEITFIKNKYKCFSVEELLYMATYTARKALNHDSCILGLNQKADFIVLDEKTLRPLYISVC